MESIFSNGRLVGIDCGDGLRADLPEDWDLFVLRLRDASEDERVIGEKQMRVTSEESVNGRISVSYVSAEQGFEGVAVQLDARTEAQEVLLSLEVTNDTDCVLVSVDFPRVPIAEVASEHALYLASPWGSRNFDPVRFLRENHDGHACRRYPADLAMQYTMVGDGRALHYLSAYHTGDETFEACCDVLDDSTLAVFNRWFPYVSRGRWSSSQNGIARLNGSWHAGADLYRSRMASVFQPPQPNEWLRENFHGWMQVGLKMEDHPPRYCFTDIPVLYERAAEVGIRVLHVYGWLNQGHDTSYPDFEICPELGTEGELRQALDEVKSMGGRVMLYTNGRLIDPNSHFFREVSRDNSIIGEDGNRPTEHYGTSVHFEIACPSAEAYREYFKNQIERIILRYGAHAVQIDQVGCNPAYLCFSKDHGHEKPSDNWVPGTERFLSELRKLYLSLDPQFFVWVEGMHERFGQYYDISQGQYAGPPWNVGEPYPEQFRYTYPNYTVTGICRNVAEICHAFAQGKPFDFYVGSLDEEDFRRLLSDLVAVRVAEPEYFRFGRFIDTVGLEVEGDGIHARAIRGGGGGVLVALWAEDSSTGAHHAAEVRGDSVRGRPRIVYPSDVSVLQGDGLHRVEWTGPAAAVAWEK